MLAKSPDEVYTNREGGALFSPSLLSGASSQCVSDLITPTVSLTEGQALNSPVPGFSLWVWERSGTGRRQVKAADPELHTFRLIWLP